MIDDASLVTCHPSLDTAAMMVFVQARLLCGLSDGTEPTGSFRSNGAARWEHTRRVPAIAQKIARAESAVYDVVTVAAIFHDVAKLDSEQDEHAARGAEIAHAYLARAGFAAEWIARVCQAIVNHPAALVFSADDLRWRIAFCATRICWTRWARSASYGRR